ncbi:MAG: rRNA pseudouridine synthase [Actinomycetota bacterium]|nr:rRNA pseudouridine synthase [Actinomycetota bacterium]
MPSERTGAASSRRGAQPDGHQPDGHQPDGIRLQKVLAQAGVASRRASEDLIASGRVQVDGRVVRELGTRVDPHVAIVAVDGERLNLREEMTYLALNKPRGVLATMSDDQNRPNVGDWVADRPERLFHVGRLDADSEGLLLMTNDGELANRLTHPSYGVPKTYLADVPAPVPRGVASRLRKGVELEDGPIKVEDFRTVQVSNGRAMVEVVVHEGRKHLVRRMLAEVGLPANRLIRTSIGPVLLGHQKPGTVRKLARGELAALFRTAGM